MDEGNTDANKISDWSFPKLKCYSVEEILETGGVDAFFEKIDKRNTWKKLLEALSKLPEDAFLTEEEAETALKMLRGNK